MGQDEFIENLAGSVSDGDSIDWNQATSEAGADAAKVRALQNLERIARFNGGLQDPTREGAANSTGVATQPRRWGDLTLLELAGAGARGEVWRAWDPSLERQVALKLPKRPLSGSEAFEAVVQEARALARVRHPHVVTVYGVGEDDGTPGLWMEFLSGPTLGGAIERGGPMSPREVARIGIDLCSALEALEGVGIVHRDIKPTNIAIECDGRFLLMDFGLGRRSALDDGTPRSSGTPLFMAPEIIAGGLATHRSDLYALGVTLWWALAGHPPFQASTLQELQEQASRGPSTRLRDLRRGIPRKLAAAIEWAMSPSEAGRPRRAAELGASLMAAMQEIDAIARRPKRVAVFALTALVALLAVFLLGRDGGFRGFVRQPPSVAVLPFANLTGDPSQEYFASGMTDELISRFSQIEGLRVSSFSSVAGLKNSAMPLSEIAKRLHVKMVVEGVVHSSSGRIRVTTKLVDAATGQAIWSHIYDRKAAEVLALHGEVATAVADQLHAKLTPSERQRLRRSREVEPDAYATYLQGLAAFRDRSRGGTLQGIEYFYKACALDSTFAEPWTQLAYAYDWSKAAGAVPKVPGETASFAEHALSLDPESGSARAILATTRLRADGDFVKALGEYRAAVALSPGDAETRIELVACLTAMGHFDAAIKEAARAREADPTSVMAADVVMFPLFEGRRYGEAIGTAKRLLATRPGDTTVQFNLGQALYFAGRRSEAIAALEKVVQADPFPEGFAWLGYMRGQNGDTDGARAALATLEEWNLRDPIDPYNFTIAYLGLHDVDQAIKHLREAVETSGGAAAMFLRVDPALDLLREDSRFQAIVGRYRFDS